MITLKYIRDNSEKVQNSLLRKQNDIDITELLNLDVKRREYIKEIEELKAEKNSVSKKVADLKKTGEG